MSNIYGIQKSPEQRVRGNREIAMGAGGGAIKGAQMGSKAGPWGAVAGAVIGGGAGYFTQKSAQAKENNALSNTKAYNAGVEALEGRQMRIKSPYSNMARYGRKYEGSGSREMEGDGSGDPNGIGEVHTDKNYNIKSIANGKPMHEEGGVPIAESNLEKGDLIFPWQKNDAKYEKGMSMIKRFKTTGDQNAKEWLDKEVKSLPSDDDYGYGEGDDKKYPDGLIVKKDGSWTYRKDPNTGKIEVKKKGGDKWIDLDEEAASGNNAIDKDIVNAEIFNSYDKLEGKNSIPGGDLKGVDNLSTGGNPISSSSDNVYNDLGVTGSSFNKDGFAEFQTNPSEVTNFNDQLGSEREPRMNKMTPKMPTSGDSSLFDKPSFDTGEPTLGIPATGSDGDIIEEEDVVTAEDEVGYAQDPIRDRTDYTKYANVARNLYKGLEDPDVTTRRYSSPEELGYEDRSYAQRSAITEQRNAGQQSLRGKGLSAGQMQGYNRQLGANATRANQQVNEREAQRADSISQYNLGNRNKASDMNLQLANQYDIQDLQNKASQQRYMNTAFSEVGQLGQINERQRYAQDRDERLMKNDLATAKLMGNETFNFSKSPYEVTMNDQVIPDYNYAESKERTIIPNKRYGGKAKKKATAKPSRFSRYINPEDVNLQTKFQ